MAGKFALVSNQTYLFLAAKTIVVCASWFFLPFWVFVLAAFGFYFAPLFKPFYMFLPFLALIFLMHFLPKNFVCLLFFAVSYFLVLGIKDLIIVQRFNAHYFLLMLLTLFGYSYYFYRFSGVFGASGILWLFFLSFLIFFLYRKLSVYKDALKPDFISNKAKKQLPFALMSFVLFQIGAVVLIMPFNFFYQTAVVFLSAIVLAEFALGYLRGSLDKKTILLNFSLFFTLIVLILSSNRWSP